MRVSKACGLSKQAHDTNYGIDHPQAGARVPIYLTSIVTEDNFATPRDRRDIGRRFRGSKWVSLSLHARSTMQKSFTNSTCKKPSSFMRGQALSDPSTKMGVAYIYQTQMEFRCQNIH